MLRPFLIFFMIAFGSVVVACGVNHGPWDAPEWLMLECIVAAVMAVPIYRRFAPLLLPAAGEEFEFDIVEDDDEEIDE